MNNIVYLEKRDVYSYPDKTFAYSPSQRYPEYPFNDIADKPNAVYDMVRSCLIGMELDSEHYGQTCWNPLGDVIEKGSTVLLKPNLVRHYNQSAEDGLDCMVTHPSVIRAIADYALIALGDTGKIIIGDAPVQSCDFSKLMETYGYNEITSFYKDRELDIPFLDFRIVSSAVDSSGILVSTKIGKETSCIAVNMGRESAFYTLMPGQAKKLRITNYDPNEMFKHHHDDIHEYLIPKIILNADVVINLPKPKTHRKTGVTIALKNLVGLNGNKDWIPHHTQGSLDQGGDEYFHKSLFKYWRTFLSERIDIANLKGQRKRSRLYRLLQLIVGRLGKPFLMDNFYEGSWYGNDTIWRTICDLNRIILYADKKGNITNKPQRKLFILADMIISGEGEGPLMPVSKQAGIIAAGYQAFAFDQTIATLMGFDTNKIPSINNADYGDHIKVPMVEPLIKSNNLCWDHCNIGELRQKKTLKFKPTSGWIGHIER